jgi:hypothetical protein
MSLTHKIKVLKGCALQELTLYFGIVDTYSTLKIVLGYFWAHIHNHVQNGEKQHLDTTLWGNITSSSCT